MSTSATRLICLVLCLGLLLPANGARDKPPVRSCGMSCHVRVKGFISGEWAVGGPVGGEQALRLGNHSSVVFLFLFFSFFFWKVGNKLQH